VAHGLCVYQPWNDNATTTVIGFSATASLCRELPACEKAMVTDTKNYGCGGLRLGIAMVTERLAVL
jgi:hypothetical protein